MLLSLAMLLLLTKVSLVSSDIAVVHEQLTAKMRCWDSITDGILQLFTP